MKGIIKRITIWFELYSCNYRKNDKCKKTHCKCIDGIEGCTNTTEWQYAKRTPLNYIKRIINKNKVR